MLRRSYDSVEARLRRKLLNFNKKSIQQQQQENIGATTLIHLAPFDCKWNVYVSHKNNRSWRYKA